MRHRCLLAALTAAALAVAAALPALAAVVTGPTTPCAQPDGRVTAMVLDGRTVYLGGRFTRVRDRTGVYRARARLAAVDADTCELLPWRADTDGEVNALEVTAGVVYAGGAFTHVDGVARARLAAIEADADAGVLPFNGRLDKPVRALSAVAGTLYAGGDFTRAQGAVRSKLAAFDLATGVVAGGWRPSANAGVLALQPSPSGGRLYVGGNFTSVGGSPHAYLALVDLADGSVDTSFSPWADYPQAPFPMIDLAADSRGLYAGGGGSGGHLVLWNLDGSLQRPVYQTDGGVQSVVPDGGSLYVGGHFTNYCLGNTGSGSPYVCTTPLERRKAFEVSLSTGQLTPWAPSMNSPHGVFASLVDPVTHSLWMGGDFTRVGPRAVSRLAVFTA